MRRTARALSVAALVVLAGAAPAGAADDPPDPADPVTQSVPDDPADPAAPSLPDDPADLAAPSLPDEPGGPAAQISPASVEPGGTVTVSVNCDPTGGPAPESIDASSQAAFADGTVKLQKVPGGDELSGPAYKGSAKIAAAEDFEGLADGASGAAWTVDGTCPAPPGGQGRPWSASFDVAHGTSHGSAAASPCPEPHRTPCGGTSRPRRPTNRPGSSPPAGRPPSSTG